MKDVINQCRQSLSILVKWLSDTDKLIEEPKDLHDVEGYEKVAMKIYETCDKKATQELAKQCRIVGLNRLASELEISMGISILEDSQELLNNN